MAHPVYYEHQVARCVVVYLGRLLEIGFHRQREVGWQASVHSAAAARRLQTIQLRSERFIRKIRQSIKQSKLAAWQYRSQQNATKSRNELALKSKLCLTRCSAIAERPRCRVHFSIGQKWKSGTGRQYFADII